MNFNVSQPVVKKLKIRYSLIFCNPTKRWKQKPKVLPKSCQTQVLLLFLFEASQNCGISMRDHHQQTGATRIRQWLSPTHGVRRNCFEQNIEWLDQRTWTLKIVPIEVSKKKSLEQSVPRTCTNRRFYSLVALFRTCTMTARFTETWTSSLQGGAT